MESSNSMESLKEFTYSFFKNIGAKFEDKGIFIIIKTVPKEFESYFGKKTPYNIVFDRSNEGENTELMARGSFLLKVMQEYLENLGQTQLLKIDFPNPEDKIKNRFILKNCSVSNPSKKDYPKYITKFTFSTVLQYLNEKEQIASPVYIKDKKSIDLNEANYHLINGNLKEASSVNIKEEYIIAKEVLKTKISYKLKEVQETLKLKLKKELDRLKKHFDQQTLELEQELGRQKAQLKRLAEESKDNPSTSQKIERIQNNIKSFDFEAKKERLLKEYNFFTKDESYKHSLNLSNRLISTGIIYYPLHLFNFHLTSGKSKSKIIELRYDPFEDSVSPLFCESCNKEIIEISLCAGGHISCTNCLKECKNCNNKVCKHCKIRVCSICTRNICEACTTKCPLCFNYMCTKHMKKEKFSGKEACMKCLMLCSGCNLNIKKSESKPCPKCKNKFCSICIKPIFSNGRVIQLCPSCAKKPN